MGRVPLLENAAGEVGHSRGHNSHSPSHRANLAHHTPNHGCPYHALDRAPSVE
jgi:hypothetical protein